MFELVDGRGNIPVCRCPRALGSEYSSLLLPYFFEFLKTGQWPDGRGRLYQQLKLMAAFGLLREYQQRVHGK